MRERVRVKDLEVVLEKSWELWTTADQGHWSTKNRAWGQCAVTALVVQDFLGGSILRIDISKNPNPLISAMRSHYFNLINGEEVDLSKGQFGHAYNLVRDLASLPEERSRDYLLGNKETKERYKNLRLRVSQILSGYEENALFEDAHFLGCLGLALESNCQKGQYGCIVRHGFDFIYSANAISPIMRNWSEPVCIRISRDIPSRTESMVGCCDHAEERALDQIRERGWDPKGCELYVAGFRSNGLIYIKPEPVFSCLRCANQLYRAKIGSIYVPCKEKWARMTTEEAVETAKKFALQEKVLENY